MFWPNALTSAKWPFFEILGTSRLGVNHASPFQNEKRAACCQTARSF